MDNLKIMTVHDKAIRLLEGGVVEIEANWFRLRRLPDDKFVYPCLECKLDSICKQEHVEVCEECDAITGGKCCLRLVSNEQENDASF